MSTLAGWLAGWNMAPQPTPQRHSRLMSLENLLPDLKGVGRTPLATQQFQLGRIINTNIFNSWWECQDLTRHVKTARQNNTPDLSSEKSAESTTTKYAENKTKKSSSKRPSCWWHCLIFMNKLRNTLEPSLKKRTQSRVKSFCTVPSEGIHHAAKRKVIRRIGWVYLECVDREVGGVVCCQW